jgi:hypothetical protein
MQQQVARANRGQSVVDKGGGSTHCNAVASRSDANVLGHFCLKSITLGDEFQVDIYLPPCLLCVCVFLNPES